jgi:hypothetical protein
MLSEILLTYTADNNSTVVLCDNRIGEYCQRRMKEKEKEEVNIPLQSTTGRNLLI